MVKKRLKHTRAEKCTRMQKNAHACVKIEHMCRFEVIHACVAKTTPTPRE